MARTDHEAVVRDLAAWVATEKPGYGQQELLAKIATLSKEHVVPESLLERALRLFGVQHVLSQPTPETGPAGGGGSASPDKEPDPGPMTEGGHDEQYSDREVAGVGRR